MNVNAISAGGGAPLGKAVEGGAAGAADKDIFITLLVAQLKNQDPLDPQDSTQFLAQLAQFNSLEQLMSINQRIGQLLDSVSAGGVNATAPAEGAQGVGSSHTK
jgi:flagellar basal-body rod modification protein FlgD